MLRPRRVVVLLLALVITVLLLVLLAFVITDDTDGLREDISKGLIQVAVVTVLGGIVGLVFPIIDRDREHRRMRDQQRLEVFQRLISAYHQLRSARRDMKFAGLHLMPPVEGSSDAKNPTVISGTVGCLSPGQVDVLRKAVRELADVQLTLDQVRRELSVNDLFDAPDKIMGPLIKLTDYVEAIVREFQTYGIAFSSETPPTDLSDFVQLRKFVAEKKVSYQTEVGWPFGAINWQVRRELFGERD